MTDNNELIRNDKSQDDQGNYGALTSEQLVHNLNQTAPSGGLLARNTSTIFRKIEKSKIGTKVPLIIRELDSRDLELVSFFIKMLYLIPSISIILLAGRLYMGNASNSIFSYIIPTIMAAETLFAFYMFSFSSKIVFPLYVIFFFVKDLVILIFSLIVNIKIMNFFIFVSFVLFFASYIAIELLFGIYLRRTCISKELEQTGNSEKKLDEPV